MDKLVVAKSDVTQADTLSASVWISYLAPAILVNMTYECYDI